MAHFVRHQKINPDSLPMAWLPGALSLPALTGRAGMGSSCHHHGTRKMAEQPWKG